MHIILEINIHNKQVFLIIKYVGIIMKKSEVIVNYVKLNYQQKHIIYNIKVKQAKQMDL